MHESAVHNLGKLKPDQPLPGRVVNAAVGGNDHFVTDSDAMASFNDVWPTSQQSMQQIPKFMQRLVRAMAQAGMEQFVIIACNVPMGLPEGERFHDIARQIIPTARLAYVEDDVMTVIKARAMLEPGNDGIRVIEGTALHPEAILADQVMTTFIDWDQPIGLVLPFHQVGGDEHLRVAGYFVEHLAPGSYIGVHQITFDHLPPEVIPKVQQAIDETVATPGIRSRAALEPIFAGLELQEPGITWIDAWRADDPNGFAYPPERCGNLGALARRP